MSTIRTLYAHTARMLQDELGSLLPATITQVLPLSTLDHKGVRDYLVIYEEAAPLLGTPGPVYDDINGDLHNLPGSNKALLREEFDKRAAAAQPDPQTDTWLAEFKNLAEFVDGLRNAPIGDTLELVRQLRAGELALPTADEVIYAASDRRPTPEPTTHPYTYHGSKWANLANVALVLTNFPYESDEIRGLDRAMLDDDIDLPTNHEILDAGHRWDAGDAATTAFTNLAGVILDLRCGGVVWVDSLRAVQPGGARPLPSYDQILAAGATKPGPTM